MRRTILLGPAVGDAAARRRRGMSCWRIGAICWRRAAAPKPSPSAAPNAPPENLPPPATLAGASHATSPPLNAPPPVGAPGPGRPGSLGPSDCRRMHSLRREACRRWHALRVRRRVALPFRQRLPHLSREDLRRVEHLEPRLRGRVADVPQVRAEDQRPHQRHDRLLLLPLPLARRHGAGHLARRADCTTPRRSLAKA